MNASQALGVVARGVAGAVRWVAPHGTRRRRALRGLLDPLLARAYAWSGRSGGATAGGGPPGRAEVERLLARAGRCWPGRGGAGEAGAACRLLDLMLDHPGLARRFPGALAGGEDGAFARWLAGPEAARLGVGRDEVALLRGALRRRPGLRLAHLYDQYPALRLAFPLALTAGGGLGYVACLLRWGGKLAVGTDEAVWFLLESAGLASRGLAEAYRRQPGWQLAVPHGLTRFGWGELKGWVRREHRLPAGSAWLDEAERPDALGALEELYWLTVARPGLADGDVRGDAGCARRAARRAREAGLAAEDGAYWRRLEQELARPSAGVNVLAHFRYPSGLQVAALHTVEALERQGLAVSRRDVPSNVRADQVGREGWVDLHPHGVTINHLAPDPLAEDSYALSGLAMRAGTYRVGYWYWEMEEAPRRWARHAAWVHEVWAPTRFIAGALRRVLPMPVYDMMPGMEMPPAVRVARGELGLPEGRYLFLFAFDMGSTAERKNPQAVIAAFRRAFPDGARVALAVKVSRGWADPGALAALRREADGRSVFVLDEVMPRERVFGLMSACDAYVSLHRSEGFGLTMAEAMALGKPVIATRYSGNLDFMNDRNSLLVDSRPVPVARSAHLYRRGGTWAEPSVAHAAELMRWLVEHPPRGRAVGEQARKDVRVTLSLDAAGRRMAERLGAIRGELAARRAG